MVVESTPSYSHTPPDKSNAAGPCGCGQPFLLTHIFKQIMYVYTYVCTYIEHKVASRTDGLSAYPTHCKVNDCVKNSEFLHN